MAEEFGAKTMTEAEKIEYLGGQVHALVGFAVAVITADEAPQRLARYIELLSEINAAKTAASLASDTYLEGLDNVQSRLKQAVETAVQCKVTLQVGE
jgi:DNA-binding GntR family transcriptional regulator